MIAYDAGSVVEWEHSDETLVERVRAGDDSAFEDLYRRHSRLAVAVARKILRSPQDAEDAAAEAFTNVLSALRRQVGPREQFRPYLLACVRNTCSLRLRQRSRYVCTRDRNLDVTQQADDEKLVESAVAAAAFQSIPTRWQSALWMAEVQHLDSATIADRLGLNAAATAALLYRARQGFAEAYLRQHLRCSGGPACASLAPKLAQYVRGTAGTMTSRQIERHVDECSSCATAISELADVNSTLRSLPAPLSVLAASATATALSGGTATTAVAGLGLGWLTKAAFAVALSATTLAMSSDTTPPARAGAEVSTNVNGSSSHVGVDLAVTTGSRATAITSAASSTPIGKTPPLGRPVSRDPMAPATLEAPLDRNEVGLPDSPSSVVPRLPAAPATDLPVTVSAHDGVAVAGNAVRDAVPSGTVPTILLPPPAAVVDPLMTALADLPQGPIPTVAPPSTPIVTVPPVTAPPPPSGISPPAVAPTRPTISVRLIGN